MSEWTTQEPIEPGVYAFEQYADFIRARTVELRDGIWRCREDQSSWSHGERKGRWLGPVGDDARERWEKHPDPAVEQLRDGLKRVADRYDDKLRKETPDGRGTPETRLALRIVRDLLSELDG